MNSAFRQLAAPGPAVAGIRLPLLIVCLSLCFHPAAHAAFYQFTIGGTVTSSALEGVNPGDPFIVQYIADSQDQYPNGTAGLYNATEPTVAFPGLTITSDGHAASFTVDVGKPGTVQLPGYLSYDPPRAWGVQCSYSFPPGTLTSDALPLTLPLRDANFAKLYIFPIYHDVLQGDITSYGAIEVPEPLSLTYLLAAMICSRELSSRTRKENGHEAREARVHC